MNHPVQSSPADILIATLDDFFMQEVLDRATADPADYLSRVLLHVAEQVLDGTISPWHNTMVAGKILTAFVQLPERTGNGRRAVEVHD